MKTTQRIAVLLLALASIQILPASESGQPNDKTLSPYFDVKTAEGGPDVMPLKSTDVDVKIVGVIADVRVTQTYANAGAQPIEASYVFPGSTRAAVYGMEMTIGERVLRAQVKAREEARRTYEQAKIEGKSTSLLEQQRPNIFQMNVANIMPGDTVKVELRYTELLVPEGGEYQFVFPTVVGPRYSNQPEAAAPESDKWVSNPYLKKGEKSAGTFNITVDVVAGMPLQQLRCDTHSAKPQFRDASSAVLTLDGSDPHANDRDFIVKYRLADSKIESGLLLSRGESENFFLLTVQPPKRESVTAIPPRDYIFVLDVSGSMNGFPLATAKKLMSRLFDTLKPNDTFNVLLFSGGSKMLSPKPLPVTRENLAAAVHIIDHEQGGGGTELLPALQQALATPNDANAARSIVVVTDGYVDCETQAFELIRNNLNRASLFAFGIGSSINRFLIEGMARAGQGEPFFVTRPDEADQQVRKLQVYISAPLLTQIAVDFGGLDVYDVEPVAVPDVLADRPVVVFGKWKGAAQGKITVRGKSGTGDYVQQFEVAATQPVEGTGALAYLWARSRIAALSDYIQLERSDERVKAVTNLGLTYNLLTAYTSFVAVDDVVRNAGGEQQKVKQPLPLPQGVENTAVGVAAPAVPEPETWALMIVVATIVGFKAYRARKARCA